MGRVKVSMVPIVDSKKRSVAFKQRKAGLVKKARELAILCDVNVSMIIFSDHQDNNPEIFPLEDPRMLNDSINAYKSNRVSEPGKIRSYGLLDFFKDRKNKIEDDLAKAKKQNLEAKYPTRFGFLNSSSEGELKNFASRLGRKIEIVKKKIESRKTASMIRNLDVQGSLITTSSNEFSLFDRVKHCGSSNPIYRVNPNNSIMSMLTMGEDKNEYYRTMSMENNKFVHGKVESYGDYYHKMLCMQSSNPVPISIDDSGCHDGANSGLPPLPEMIPLPKQSPFLQMNSFMMSSFPSQVINY